MFSQAALNALVRNGMDRDHAYRIVQEAAVRVTGAGTHLRDEVLADERVGTAAADVEAAFDLDRHLAHAGDGVDHLGRVTADWLRSGRKD